MSPRRRSAIEWAVALLVTAGCLIASEGDVRTFILYGLGVLAVGAGAIIVLLAINLALRWLGGERP